MLIVICDLPSRTCRVSRRNAGLEWYVRCVTTLARRKLITVRSRKCSSVSYVSVEAPSCSVETEIVRKCIIFTRVLGELLDLLCSVP